MFFPTMNLLDILTRFYGILHSYNGVPFWVLTPFRRLTRAIANILLPKYLKAKNRRCGAKERRNVISCTESGNKQKNNKIVVSLTSFPARINNVWQVIICMLNQTLLPDEIILWLSKEQFPTADTIPQSLRELEGDIFKIRMVDDDLRSHKKYYYISLEYVDANVFLIDDDIYYPSTLLEDTWTEYLKHENAVICNFGFHIKYNADGVMESYNTWIPCHEKSSDKNLFFGSGGGTLFQPSKMFKDLTNVELFTKLTPSADDIWLNAMARIAGMEIIIIRNGLILPIANKKNSKLSSVNVGMGQNDIQLKNVSTYYRDKNIWD